MFGYPMVTFNEISPKNRIDFLWGLVAKSVIGMLFTLLIIKIKILRNESSKEYLRVIRNKIERKKAFLSKINRD